MPESKYRFELSARDYAASLFALAGVFVFTHLGLYYYNYHAEELPWLLLQLFDLDEENNLPTWFSSFVLLNVAFFVHLASTQPEVEKRLHWRFIALGFFILSVDEVAGMHETFNSSIEINWAIPGAILVLFVAAAFVPFLLALPGRLAAMFVLSGALFVSGAIVTALLSEDMDSDSWAYAMAVALEEGLEMIGALLFLYLNLREMAIDGRIRLESSAV